MALTVLTRWLLLSCLILAGGCAVPKAGPPAGPSSSPPAGAATAQASCAEILAAATTGRAPPRGSLRVETIASPGGLALPASSDAPRSAAAGCTLLVTPIDGSLAVASRTLERKTLPAERRIRVDRRVNPEHKAAAKALREAAGDDTSLNLAKATGDLSADMLTLAIGGVAAGLDFLLDWYDESSAREKLANTPRFIEQAIWEPYPLDLRTVELSRTLSLKLALVDPATGTARTAEVPVSDVTVLEIGRNLEPLDRGRLEGQATYRSAPEVRELQRQLPLVDVDRLLVQAAAALAAARPVAGDSASLAAAWRQAPTALAEGVGPGQPPTHPGVVRVAGMAGRGQGVYVAPELVLTARSLIGGTSLIEIVGADGIVTYGIVEREDAEQDLALVYVQKQGASAPIDPTAKTAPAAWEALPGTPLFTGDQLVGLTVSDGPELVVNGAAIQRFVAMSPVQPLAPPAQVASRPANAEL